MDTAALRELLGGSLASDADSRRRTELQLKQVCGKGIWRHHSRFFSPSHRHWGKASIGP